MPFLFVLCFCFALARLLFIQNTLNIQGGRGGKETNKLSQQQKSIRHGINPPKKGGNKKSRHSVDDDYDHVK